MTETGPSREKAEADADDADVEAWQRFRAIAAEILRPHGIAVGPIRCTDISGMKADLYRRSTPVPSDFLNAPGFP